MRLPTPILFLFFLCLPVTAFESLIQAQGELRKDFPAQPLRFASPNWSFYHRTLHLNRYITNLSSNCPNAHVMAKIVVPGENLAAGGALSSDRHREVDFQDPDIPFDLSSVSDGLLYFIVRSLQHTDPISRARRFASGLLRRFPAEQPTRVMFVFGEEGRDLLSSEIALRVLRDVCGQSAPNEAIKGNPPRPGLRLKDGVELVLVPILNPDGRRISEMGRRCDHTNANDVDIDRNWPSFWGEASSGVSSDLSNERLMERTSGNLRDAVTRSIGSKFQTTQYSSLSHGTHPFSERETRSLKAIVEKMQPKSYVSVRTGALALTIPWDCKPSLLPDAQRAKLLRLTETITAAHCARCKTGNLWNVTGRVKCGTSTDYIYGTLRVPFVHTWHVYDAPAPRGDCFRRHNPVSKVVYDRVTENWANAIFNFSNAVFNWITLENSKGLRVAEENASLSAAHASAARAKVLAQGDLDSEIDEINKSNLHETSIGSSTEQNLGPMTKQGKQTRFSWFFGDQPDVVLNSADVRRAKRKVGPVLPEEPAPLEGDNVNGILTGWWGVWTAFLLMGTGFYIAKRYVFRKGMRRSFLNYSAVKHA